ncbi:MAG: RDD family protein [Nocardioides sp.]
MSNYGAPPPPPHDPNQPNPYGGQQAYGAPAQVTGNYAHWGKRVGSYLIDGLLTSLAAIPLLIGYGIIIAGFSTTTGPDGVTTLENNDINPLGIILVLVGILTSLGFSIWNTCLKQGKTGYSIGKGVMGIKLIGESTGQPVGAGMAFVRQLAHILDGFCFIGYLWPLWDAKRQTFADKVMSTVVIEQPKP